MTIRVGVTAVVGLMLVVSAAIVIFTGDLAKVVGDTIGLGSAAVTTWNIAEWPVLLILVSLMFATLCWASPDAKTGGFRWVSPGGIFAVFLWILVVGAVTPPGVRLRAMERTSGRPDLRCFIRRLLLFIRSADCRYVRCPIRGAVMLPAATASTPVPNAAVVAVREVLTSRQVQPLFQPIVDLDTRAVVAVEALARGPAGTALELPDGLFAAARAAGVVGELDLLCCERALECAIAAPVTPPVVFVNAEPGVLNQPLSPRLIELVRNGLPFREVLEFTERALPAVPGSMLRIAGMVQQWGNSLALDDVGVDPMSLAFLPVLEPEVIKLDMSLVRNPDTPHSRAVSAVVQAEAQRTGAVVIAEGIETESDLTTARRLGARWGQGWLFGRPGRLEHTRHAYDYDGVDRLRTPRPGFHQPDGTPFQIAARQSTPSPATSDAVRTAFAQLRDIVATDAAIMVIASASAGAIPDVSGSWQELVGRARSVLILDTPIPDECSVAVIAAGHGAAACIQTGQQPQLVFFEQLPMVAEIARALLSRLQ